MDGGKRRIGEDSDDGAESRCCTQSESDLFPMPPGCAFPTDDTARHSANPTFDFPPVDLSIDFAQNDMSCRPVIITGTCNNCGLTRNDPSSPCGPLLNVTASRERSPTSMGSDCSIDQSTVLMVIQQKMFPLLIGVRVFHRCVVHH